ncbi:MAG: copper chaperone PCu(A)C [Rhodanobacter sp.]
MKLLRVARLCTALLLGAVATIASASSADEIRVSHAWLRILPGALPAGGYATLHNQGDQPAALTGASSDVYAQVMLHQSSVAGGTNRMRMVHAMSVPARGNAQLAPGGYHLMLEQPRHPVRPGDVVRLTLTFADGSTRAADFVARPANAIDAGDTHSEPAIVTKPQPTDHTQHVD